MGLNQWTDNHADDGRGADGRPTPRHGRASLLRLAAWFEESDPDRADALAAASYALHPALHLEGRVDEGVAATTSWWQADADRSTVTEHPGARPPEPVSDHRAQQARLRDAAESSAHWRRAGAAQIRSLLTEPTGRRARLDLSGAGMEVLMELLTAALGSGDASRRPTSAGDLEFALRLHVIAAPGADVTIRGEGGELTLEGLRLLVTPYEQHSPGDLDPLPEAPEEDGADPLAAGAPEGEGAAPEGEEASAASRIHADPLAPGTDEDLSEAAEEPSEDPLAPAASVSPDAPADPEASVVASVPTAPADSEAPAGPSVLDGPGASFDPRVPVTPESAQTSGDPLAPADSPYSAASDRSTGPQAPAGTEAPTASSAPTDTKNPETPAAPFDPRLPTTSGRSASTGTPTAPSAPRNPFAPAASEDPKTPPSPALPRTPRSPAASSEPLFPQPPSVPPYSAHSDAPPAPEIPGTPTAPSYADILGIPVPYTTPEPSPAPDAAPRPEDTEPTGNLPGPDPRAPGPDDLSANPPEKPSWE
ncbi:DUF2397 family protein [Nocardiopsis dassonvillei]|uniref:DUF2397 family protein n=1 Tax=Nocardiopsis dassonvillei TaxID=2014 RepID=UPI00102CF392|nr:DUF2397 family protein [Nocardiopsis dassonvillei]MCP3015810.1 DUF2397 family protein [Nocardiopsis dassonvillei]